MDREEYIFEISGNYRLEIEKEALLGTRLTRYPRGRGWSSAFLSEPFQFTPA